MFNFLKKNNEPKKLFYTTDMHCHIIPGVDHGAQTVDDSIALVKAEMEMGISHIIATSHVTKDSFENNPETLAKGFATLKAGLEKAGIDIDIKYSAEYRIDELFKEQLKNNQLVLMPNNYLLVENSFQGETMGLDELLFELQLKDYIPILAHPERYRYYNHQRYQTLHDSGAYFQVNLLSFTGYFGEPEKRTAEWLLDNELIDFLGSDIHFMQHAEILQKFIGTKEYRKIVERIPRLCNDISFN
jgi:protein-tyrosine phosphatase